MALAGLARQSASEKNAGNVAEKLLVLTPVATHLGGFSLRLNQMRTILKRIVPGPLIVHEIAEEIAERPRLFQVYRDLAAVGLHVLPGYSVQGLSPTRRDAILARIEREQPSDVLLVHPYAVGLLPELKARGIRVIIDCHNIESDLARQLFHLTRPAWKRSRILVHWRAVLRWEQLYFPLADQIWIPSHADATRLVERFGARVRIRCVPNALDLDQYEPQPSQSSHEILLPGNFGYLPNVQGAEIFCKRVLPAVRRAVPDATLILAGSDPYGLANRLCHSREIITTGEVADIRPIFARSGVVVVPVLNGGGTRFKILEALALERPVVSTPLGSEGLMVEDGKHLWIREIEDFAESIVHALLNPDEGQRLARNGRRRVQELYSWDAVEPAMRAAFDRGPSENRIGADVSRHRTPNRIRQP